MVGAFKLNGGEVKNGIYGRSLVDRLKTVPHHSQKDLGPETAHQVSILVNSRKPQLKSSQVTLLSFKV